MVKESQLWILYMFVCWDSKVFCRWCRLKLWNFLPFASNFIRYVNNSPSFWRVFACFQLNPAIIQVFFYPLKYFNEPLSILCILRNSFIFIPFQLLSFICELHAEKVCEQPHEFLVNILAVIELGLTLFGIQITGICCEFIQFFSRYLCLHAAQLQPEKFLLLQPFLKVFWI